MKKFGFYMLYPPFVELSSEGLGRLLCYFIEASMKSEDYSFIIACPSWMKKNILLLFEDMGIPKEKIEIIHPRMSLYLSALTRFRSKKKNREKLILKKTREKVVKRFIRDKKKYKKKYDRVLEPNGKLVSFFSKLAFSNNLLGYFILLCLLPLVIVFSFVFSIIHSFGRVFLKTKAFMYRFLFNVGQGDYKKIKRSNKIFGYISFIFSKVRLNPGAIRELYMADFFYELMLQREVLLLHKMIASRKDISAWYSPTCFWPQFTQIDAPQLLCVPDVVLNHFPINFSFVGGNWTLNVFKKIEKTIIKSKNFVTYSENIKQETLVDKYKVDPNKVFTVPHGTIDLMEEIKVIGIEDDNLATQSFARSLFAGACEKSVALNYAKIYAAGDVKFIFYASQSRPNKNIPSLLRAYNYLLKRRYIGAKLVLTCRHDIMPEIENFIKDCHLQHDVLFLSGLTSQELAACYHLADLSVNPSLSEGGCPFTLTESLSVDTPVVMSNIPVTLEVIKDEELRKEMLFDPYDWRDMANRIEWALENKEELLKKQKVLYKELEKRTWAHVVDEYVAVLDRISSEEREEELLQKAA